MIMPKILEDRTVIVTGGGAGIGRAACLCFSDGGAKVVIADLDETNGRETLALIEQQSGTAMFIRTDVSQEADVKALVDETVKRFGRLDGAFNNAGIAQSHKLLHKISGSEWQRVIDVDLTGVFWCMKYEIAAMLETGGGAIVNTSSALGAVAMPITSDYTAAKHGVMGLTRAAAVDYGNQKIRVNAILPGITMTPIVQKALKDAAFAQNFDALVARHPIGRAASPEEIAMGARWLLSDEAAYVTGSGLALDGGYTAA
jgi:NAD(P)-dependent dehydrogenase (short-subunit alcohol dehydrogenase family)